MSRTRAGVVALVDGVGVERTGGARGPSAVARARGRLIVVATVAVIVTGGLLTGVATAPAAIALAGGWLAWAALAVAPTTRGRAEPRAAGAAGAPGGAIVGGRLEALALAGDVTLLALLYGVLGAGWWLGGPSFAAVVAVAGASLPRRHARALHAYAAVALTLLLVGDATGVLGDGAAATAAGAGGALAFALVVSAATAGALVLLGELAHDGAPEATAGPATPPRAVAATGAPPRPAAAAAPRADAPPRERVELDAQLRQAQRMELVGQLAGGMAHDFNNLLTIITASTRFASDALPDGSPVHDELAAIDDAARRAAQLTRQLLAFGRKQLPHPELLDLNAVVAGLEPLLRRVIGEDIEVLTRPAAAGGAVVGDQGQLEQVLVNLAVNARDAMPHGGRLLIETADVVLTAADGARHGVDIPPGPYVRLTVCDTGQGMDDATRARAFEPFFTTKEPGKGTGLGLAIVYGIVKQAGGFVWLASTPGRGTRIDVDLPRAAADHPPAPTLGADALAPPGTETLLLVEDADDVRHVARRILTARGYTVIEACDGRAALRAADGHAGPIDLVVTDVVMPEMSGRCLAQQLGVKRPGLRALFMSGYTDDEIVRRGLAAAGAAFLPKPFSADRLAAAVRATLDAPVLRGGET